MAQAIRPAKNEGLATGPKDIAHTVAVPDTVMALLKTSCYDCHSNHTTYPWYDRIAPVSWWVSNHISEGKRELNFSVFGEYTARRQAKKMEETAEQVEEGEMPINSYLIMHGDAKLNDRQKKLVIDWVKATQAKIGVKPQ